MADSGTQSEGSPDSETMPVPRCYPRWRGKPVFDGNKEAIGFTLVSISSFMNYVAAGAFLTNTILRLAGGAAQCHQAAAAGKMPIEMCGPQITFIKPSSIITFYATVVSFVAVFFLPVIGAIIDYTSHRLLIGRISSAILTIFLLPLMFLNQFNYISLLVVHGCSVFADWFVKAIQYAYLPELTSDELKLNEWTKFISMWTYAIVLLYLVGVAFGFMPFRTETNGLLLTQIGMGINFGINAICLQVAFWSCFRKREPLHKLPEDSSVCSIGFKQIFNTGSYILRNKYRSLKWWYVSVIFNDIGWQSFGIVLLTYLTDTLQFTALHVTICIIISLGLSVPGAMLGTFVSRRTDPIKSNMVYVVLMILAVVISVVILYEPGQQRRTYIYFIFFGMLAGWKKTVDLAISSSIIPEGQSTEIMAFYLFCGQIFQFFPTLVFTVLNEAGFSQRINVAIMAVYLVLALFSLCLTGGYAQARVEVNRDSVFKEGGGVGVLFEGNNNASATADASAPEDPEEKTSSPETKPEETVVVEA